MLYIIPFEIRFFFFFPHALFFFSFRLKDTITKRWLRAISHKLAKTNHCKQPFSQLPRAKKKYKKSLTPCSRSLWRAVSWCIVSGKIARASNVAHRKTRWRVFFRSCCIVQAITTVAEINGTRLRLHRYAIRASIRVCRLADANKTVHM